MLTAGALCALAAGDYFFISKKDILENNILSYIIPFFYLLLSSFIAKKAWLFNNSFFKMRSCRYGAFKAFFSGIFCLLIPLLLSIGENIFPFLDKQPAANFPALLGELLLLSICVAIFEEGLFRYLILRLLFKDDTKKSLWLGFLFSSFLFGLIHLGNLSIETQRPVAISTQVIYAIFLGMLLAALYLRFKSFSGIVLLHAFVDFLSFYPKIYGQDLQVTSKALADITFSESLTTIALLFPSAILGIIILVFFSKKYYANQ